MYQFSTSRCQWCYLLYIFKGIFIFMYLRYICSCGKRVWRGRVLFTTPKKENSIGWKHVLPTLTAKLYGYWIVKYVSPFLSSLYFYIFNFFNNLRLEVRELRIGEEWAWKADIILSNPSNMLLQALYVFLSLSLLNETKNETFREESFL